MRKVFISAALLSALVVSIVGAGASSSINSNNKIVPPVKSEGSIVVPMGSGIGDA